MKTRFYIAIMLLASLTLAGCSSTSDSGSTYTVKRGDTLYAYLPQHGHQRTRTGAPERHLSAIYY